MSRDKSWRGSHDYGGRGTEYEDFFKIHVIELEKRCLEMW